MSQNSEQSRKAIENPKEDCPGCGETGNIDGTYHLFYCSNRDCRVREFTPEVPANGQL